MPPGKPGTRADSLVESIETLIDERRMAPGERLGTKDELRQRTGFARATVNEAVRMLEDRGRVAIKPGRGGGLYVAAASPIVRLRHTLLTVGDSAPTVADAIAVREALEPLVTAEAARHRTREDIADLRGQLTVLRCATESTDRFMRENWMLHERIAQITPNQMLKGLYLGLTRGIEELSVSVAGDDLTRQAEHLQARFEIHVELTEAIIAGDLGRTRAAVALHAGV